MKLTLLTALFAISCTVTTGPAAPVAPTTPPPTSGEAVPPPPPPPPGPGPTSVAQRHPAYLHALSDLRAARAYLQKPTNAPNTWNDNALLEVEGAMQEIRQAAIDDGKPLEDHPPVDANMEWGNRLQRAQELVETARRDVNQEEDNAFANGLKARAIAHLDRAHAFISDGVRNLERGATPPPPKVDHPAYLRALSDLRAARGFLEKPTNAPSTWNDNALHEVDEAINAIRQAAIDDGKPLTEHPPIDAGMLWGNRLQRAQELLGVARKDINQDEDNAFANGLKSRAIGHIDRAEQFVKDGIRNLQRQPGHGPH